MRELLLLRHGKSDWHAGAATDFERPLNRRGHGDAERVGTWLQKQALIPDLVLSSPAQRTTTTSELVTTSLQCGRPHFNERLYLADCSTLTDILSAYPEAPHRVLLVGHNPGLEELLTYLCPVVPVPTDGKKMPTAAIAHLRMPGSWKALPAGSAELLFLTRPSELP